MLPYYLILHFKLSNLSTGSIILFAQLQTWIKWSIQNGFLNPIRRFKEKLNCNLMVKKIFIFKMPSIFSIIKSHLLEKLKKVEFNTELLMFLISLVILAFNWSKVYGNGL